MSDITEFNAGDLALRPSQTGEESLVRSAYRIGAFGRQTAQAYDTAGRAIGGGIAAAGQMALQYEDHREISDGMKTGAQLLLDKTQDLNKTLKNPNLDVLKNPGAGRQWLDQSLEPALDDFQSQFHTERSQEWAMRFADRVREGLGRTAAADISTRSGVQVRNNNLQSIDTFAAAVYNDPSQLGLALDSFNHGLDGAIGSSPGLSAEKGAEIRAQLGFDGPKQIVQAAVHGVIAKGGDWHYIADDPRYAPYINVSEIQSFARVDKFYRNADRIQQEQQIRFRSDVATADMHAAVNDSWSKHVHFDPATGRAVIDPQFVRELVALPTTHPDAPQAAETAKTYIDWAESEGGKAVSDPATLGDLTSRMFDPDHPTTEVDVIKARTAHKLGDGDFRPMLQLVKTLNDSPFKGPVWTNTMSAVKNYYLDHSGKDDPNGSLAFARFTQTFVPAYLAQSRSGSLPPDAMNMNDPKSLIRRSMASFTGSLSDAVRRVGSGQSAFVPPAGWMFNAKRQQYRDPDGKIYDFDGEPVK